MINLEGVCKEIKGKSILNNINYNFEKGKIYGLYGRNGSGKTMLLRAIAGLIFLTKGRIIIDNKELHRDISFPPSVGIIIENTNLLPQYDAYTNLKILSEIKKVARDNEIKKAIKDVGLNPEDKAKVKTYSLGMKQRLAIAQALFENPDLLLLDEPTNALDDKSIEIVRELFIQKKNEGKTIIIASHNKDDLRYLSDIILRMEDGKLSVMPDNTEL